MTNFISNISNILNHLKDWKWMYYQLTNNFLGILFKLSKNKGVYVVDKEWDNLIILDACSFELFGEYIKKNKGLTGNLRKVVSRGSSTPEFLLENFGKGNFKDIVYISSNPFIKKILKKPFYDEVSLWLDLWDDDKKTVLPEDVVKKSMQVIKTYKNKKFIIHFMQPHCPFIGSYSLVGNFWRIALTHGCSKVMKAYESNLAYVMPYVIKLCKNLSGKTVITADHGNACGEKAFGIFPIYGHPTGVHIDKLVEVPWFVFDDYIEY